MKNLRLQNKFTCLLALACFAVCPSTQAVDPPPDGGYPNQNTAEGEDALFSLTTGAGNTATGFDALYNTTTGSFNTASGSSALFSNTTGDNNTTNGWQALYTNTIGFNNTATGASALQSNTTGRDNTANGLGALFANTIGSANTATGALALQSNIIGKTLNTIGNDNAAVGISALVFNTTGSKNAAVGNFALYYNTTGNNNIDLGYEAGMRTTGNNNIHIGNDGHARDNNTIRIGRHKGQTTTFIAGITGTTVPNGVGVIVGSSGKLGTVVSSARYKDEIRPMNKTSEAILALEPVTFRYKPELDPDGIPQFGLVAEEVAKVNPDLVARDDQGKPYTVRYEAVNAMLLNEFLKEHRKVEEQDSTINELKSALEQHQKQIGLLTSQMQRVSDQLTTSQTAPPMLVNSR